MSLKPSFTLLGAAALAFGLACAPASARDGQNGAIIGGLAAGVVGGVVGSALVNGMNNQPPPPPPPEYRPRRVYVEEPETVIVRERRGPICHYERRKEWLDDESFTFRRVQVCE
ncbi:hypothetical protein [Methylobacterium aerolatum]|uniref:Glycine zipper domain-containing protein n=1 Tax=Methylobacterium aerolatum TaxID=418708 RepID=A0ABU0I3K8_9HYPH|nr:hypothetical protein [Methylobacterium aerolatum]MDQ0448495.1 hypothetical protein [Methylobacterium aerolatum]GJD34576.1 hypothetical protein FMGBMHLM_1478 [Methylobacterium aerolatum]